MKNKIIITRSKYNIQTVCCDDFKAIQGWFTVDEDGLTGMLVDPDNIRINRMIKLDTCPFCSAEILINVS